MNMQSEQLMAWRANSSLSTLRDLQEELGVCLGSFSRLICLAKQVGRASEYRRTYVQQIAWLRERREWIRAAIANK